MIRFLADENFSGPVVGGLRRRCPAVDLVTVQELGLYGIKDPALLARAADDDRVVLTHDRQTMPGFAYDRLARGEPVPGLFVADNERPVGVVIGELEIYENCSEHAEWAGQVKFIP